MRIVISLLTLCIVIFGTGCQAIPVEGETPTEAISTPLAPPDQGDPTQMPTPIPTQADPGLQSLIEKAKADLVGRLSIAANEITLLEAKSVVWPDSSLGCPEKDMVYTQVLTPGYLILLEHGGNTYEYHAGMGSTVTTCVNPSPPVPGEPGNT